MFLKMETESFLKIKCLERNKVTEVNSYLRLRKDNLAIPKDFFNT